MNPSRREAERGSASTSRGRIRTHRAKGSAFEIPLLAPCTRTAELRGSFGAPDYPVGHLRAPEGETFVAWEPMTAPTNAPMSRDGLRHVAPGPTFAASFTVAVSVR